MRQSLGGVLVFGAMTRLGVVTGLRAESRIIERSALRAGRAAPAVACAGASGTRAQALAARLIGEGAGLIVSFGLCGGLEPGLRPGTVMVAETVLGEDGAAIASDAAARARLFEALFAAGLRPGGGAILGSDVPIAHASEKARLYAETGARGVDMESHGVARAAQAAGIPLLVVRAVADPAERDLPHAALVATASDGGLRSGAIMGALARRPWEIPAMMRLGREARAAFTTLERAAELLGGG